MSRSLFKPVFRYTPLDEEKNGFETIPSKASIRLILTYVLAILCIAGVSFGAGRYSTKDPFQSDFHYTVSQIFRHNKTFGEPPSNLTDKAWHSLFPRQGGFFRHPTIAPERSAFSVFHQLHCLKGVREGYWTTLQAGIAGQKLVVEDLPMMAAPVHIEHCIDLLRQSLMCLADTTVEVSEGGGVTGFGTEHRCRDWGQLVRWTSEWETFGQKAGNRTNGIGHVHGV